MQETEKRLMSWEEYTNLVRSLSRELSSHNFDMIVGICRGGLPLAVSLSHNLGCRNLGVVMAKKMVSDTVYEFDQKSDLIISDFALPECKSKSVLVVDDIVAYGDLFTSVLNLLESHYHANIDVTYASLYADIEQIRISRYSRILERLHYGKNIDNKVVWIVFPWEDPLI